MMEAHSFLETLAGVAWRRPERTNRLATIDPAYVSTSHPGTLPKVTFDGESTLSTKRYASLYRPKPGDRVLMVPVGTTYVIVGAIGGE